MASADSSPMRIDHSELKQAAREFAAEETNLSSETDLILRKIAALGDIYGDDDSGRNATQNFQKVHDNITKYASSLCAAYGKTSDALVMTEKNVATANWNIVAALPDVTTEGGS